MLTDNMGQNDQSSKWCSFVSPEGIINPREFINKLKDVLRGKEYMLTINYVVSTIPGGDRLRVRVLKEVSSSQIQAELQQILGHFGLRLGEYLGDLKFKTVKE